ncbi:hypothetical protein [Diaminobutyricimonas sp. TR449]|uniref:hypothetical protein n=1 Tax=Diaminobutyricimonas sp. TR449 TaxID=2708076 RepID=UPI001FBB9497|nr:hypothetical protein [Diaminobutyricimonas sp. TR449]
MVAVAVLVLALAPGLQLLRDGRVRMPRGAVLLAGSAALVAIGIGLVRGWPVALVVLQASTVAASVLVIAVPVTARSLLFAAGWVLLVQLPLGFAVFDGSAGFETTIGARDFAGGLSLAVALGAAVLLWGRTTREHARHRVLSGGALTALGLVATCVAAQTVVDAVVLRILVACLLSAVAGAVGWLVARRIAADRLRAADAVFGTLTGLVAALASCASVTPQWSLLIGLVAGAIGGLLAGRFARRTRSGVAFCAAMLLAGGVIGTFALGLFVDGSGLVHTGGVDQFVAQTQATAVAVCWSILVSLLLMLGLRPRTQGGADQRSDDQRSVDQQSAAGLLAGPAGGGATGTTDAAERD